jgi:hypothetical protein
VALPETVAENNDRRAAEAVFIFADGAAEQCVYAQKRKKFCGGHASV